MGCDCGHAEEVAALKQLAERQAANIRRMQLSLERRNRELDALHYVWCTGGCQGGVHRWTDELITREVVEHAERQAQRLRTWYQNVEYRLKAPVLADDAARRAECARAKTDLPPR